MKLKVCGMKYNTLEVATLQPDYLGFIFWEPSKRYFSGRMPSIDMAVKKVGVFVNATVKEITEKIDQYGLQAVQLHGNESPEFCIALRNAVLVSAPPERSSKQVQVEVIKVFSIKDDFDFAVLEPFESVCDFYLFDTKGKLPGGNGYTFDWTVLKKYPSKKRFFLSGGIGLEEVEKVLDFLKTEASEYCHVIDVNSRFEIEPGLKDIDKLKEFKTHINAKH